MSALAIEVDAQPDPDSPPGIAQYYIEELELAERYQEKYLKRCKTITERYRDQRADAEASLKKRRYAVLWSNTEIMKPVCYAKVPTCVVQRRFKDADPVGRVATEVLERAINYSLDSYDFDQVLKSLRDDYLLFARGVPWARYVPTFGPAPQPPEAANDQPPAEGAQATSDEPGASSSSGQPEEIVTYEEVVCDHVALEDFGTNAARTWPEVWLGYRKTYQTRAQLKKRFTGPVEGMPGKTIGDVIPLDWKSSERTGDDTQKTEQGKKAVIYELWDKNTKQRVFISRAYASAPLEMTPDPLELKDFFPFPKPAYGTLPQDAVIPVPDYIYYQDQAEEVDELTGRIGKLTEALRMVGFYAGDAKDEISNVFTSGSDNKLIPVDSWAAWKEKGGVAGLIEWVPIEKVMEVLTGLAQQREQRLGDIEKLIGIFDIMRGDTDADETATAVGIKNVWGSSRVREKQKEMARLARDVMRIKGSIIATKFSVDTLKAMTNVPLLMNAEKQQIAAYQQLVQQQQAQFQQQQAMAAQQPPQGPPMPGQPPAPPVAPAPQMQPPPPPPPPFPPDKMKLFSQPSWEDVEQLLKSDQMRSFRIDIESDSTVELDQQVGQEKATKFLTAIGEYLAQSLPAVQAAKPLLPLVTEGLKYLTRQFDVGREFEPVIDQVMADIAAMPPPPAEGGAKGKSPEEVMVMAQQAQNDRLKLTTDIQTHQMEQQNVQVKAQAEVARSDNEVRTAQIEALRPPQPASVQ